MLAPVDVTNIVIETECLTIRGWKMTDLADFFAYASIDGVGQMAGWKPHQTMAESEAILAHFIESKKTFALEMKETGHVIGSLGLEAFDPVDPHGADLRGRELGYVLSKAYWGRGLMTEAVKAVIDHCFRVLDFDYLTCGHFIRNDRSRRVIEKTGFRFFSDSEFETQLGTVEPCKNYILYNPYKER